MSLSILWSPEKYKKAAFLAKAAAEEMLSRLDWMVIKPTVIVDMGCGPGDLAVELAKRYPAATVYAVDQSAAMLAAVAGDNLSTMLADAAKLSLADHSVDLLCANFLLPWVSDISACLQEWRRILAPNGLLMISTLGLSTLKELPASSKEALHTRLVDMHDLGDALVAAGFADPVLDTATFPVRYRSSETLQQELQASGFISDPVDCQAESITFEVVHAHAFAPLASAGFKADADGVVRVPLSHLRRTRPGE